MRNKVIFVIAIILGILCTVFINDVLAFQNEPKGPFDITWGTPQKYFLNLNLIEEKADGALKIYQKGRKNTRLTFIRGELSGIAAFTPLSGDFEEAKNGWFKIYGSPTLAKPNKDTTGSTFYWRGGTTTMSMRLFVASEGDDMGKHFVYYTMTSTQRYESLKK